MGQSTLVKVHWLLASQFGLDPLRFIRSLRSESGTALAAEH